MASTRSVSRRDLEVEEDVRFQERMWLAERIAWVVFALIILLALLGLTGQGGLLQRATVSGPTGAIEHPRVTRWATSDEIVLTVGAGGAAEAVVELGPRFTDVFAIEGIQPTPAESLATPAGERLVFALDGDGPKTVTLNIRARKPAFAAPIQARIDGVPLTASAVVLP